MLSSVTAPHSIPLSILDLAIIGRGETAADALRCSVTLAQRAEQHGYRRIWYAEHHNMASIASSATSVRVPRTRRSRSEGTWPVPAILRRRGYVVRRSRRRSLRA
jgi:hypothetical protein